MAPTGGLKEEQKRRIEDNRKALTKRDQRENQIAFLINTSKQQPTRKNMMSVCWNMHNAIQRQTENFATWISRGV